jgi:hypothetical protein
VGVIVFVTVGVGVTPNVEVAAGETVGAFPVGLAVGVGVNSIGAVGVAVAICMDGRGVITGVGVCSPSARANGTTRKNIDTDSTARTKEK